jgi:hypothetical protein
MHSPRSKSSLNFCRKLYAADQRFGFNANRDFPTGHLVALHQKASACS